MQIEAKKGVCIKTCIGREHFLEIKDRLERASVRNREMMNKELVYIVLPIYSKIGGRVVQYQIYLVDKPRKGDQ